MKGSNKKVLNNHNQVVHVLYPKVNLTPEVKGLLIPTSQLVSLARNCTMYTVHWPKMSLPEYSKTLFPNSKWRTVHYISSALWGP